MKTADMILHEFRPHDSHHMTRADTRNLGRWKWYDEDLLFTLDMDEFADGPGFKITVTNSNTGPVASFLDLPGGDCQITIDDFFGLLILMLKSCGKDRAYSKRVMENLLGRSE